MSVSVEKTITPAYAEFTKPDAIKRADSIPKPSFNLFLIIMFLSFAPSPDYFEGGQVADSTLNYVRPAS